MKKNCRVCPWTDKNEWTSVYHGLFSDISSTEYISAMRQVNIWRIRGRVPVSVESTCALLEALYLDETKKISSCELQMIYGMAITRFVNGIVDRQQKGMYSVPVAQIAADMDIPRLLVDIRHAATHDNLPALSVLKRAADLGLKWLNDNYWQVQLRHGDEVKSELQLLFGKYKEERKSQLKQLSIEEFESDIPLSAEGLSLCKDILASCPVDYYTDVLIPLLVSAGVLIPLTKKKRPTLESGLYRPLIRLWDPLLHAIGNTSHAFLHDLLSHILSRLATTNVPCKKGTFDACLIVWAAHLIREIAANGGFVDSLLQTVLEIPGMGTTYLVNLDVFDVLRDSYTDQCDIAINFSSIHTRKSTPLKQPPSLEQINQHISNIKAILESHNQDNVSKSAETSSNGPWTECSVEYRNYPLGFVIE